MEVLTLGSIVILKGGYKKLMIIGRKIISRNIVYDYMGILYPEGYLGEEYCYVFNTADIEQILYEGYSDLEEKAFVNALENLAEEM